GAFQHQDIGPLRCYRWPQERRMGCTKVTGENDALTGVAGRVGKVEFDIGRAEDMAGTLQTNPAVQAWGFMQGEPGLIGQRDDALLDQIYIALDLLLVPADT